MREIAFVLNDVQISGGVNVIFSHARNLAKAGDRITFVSKVQARQTDLYWHPIRADFSHPNITWATFGDVRGKRFDYAIATYWATLFHTWKLTADKYLYLVQSIESRFFPLAERTTRNVVEATYELPLGIITVSPWMAQYLNKVHRRPAVVVRNGIDKTVFSPNGGTISPRPSGRLRALVEGNVDARIKNIPRSIELCRQAGCDEIWLLTGTDIRSYDGVDRVFSRLPIDETPRVYRSCDVLVKLSFVEGMFGPPLEMFHCGGTAVVYEVTGHDDYIVHGANALVARSGDDDRVVSYLRQLRAVPELVSSLKSEALATAQRWPDWAESSREFSSAIDTAGREATVTRRELQVGAERLYQFLDSKPSPVTSSPGLAQGLEEQVRALESRTNALSAENHQLRTANLKLILRNADDTHFGKLAVRLRRIRWKAARTLKRGRSREESEIRFLVDKIRTSKLFDRDWYLWVNRDVRVSGVDPIEHYVRFGAWENRDPSPGFSTAAHLGRHPELREYKLNPLVHFMGGYPSLGQDHALAPSAHATGARPLQTAPGLHLPAPESARMLMDIETRSRALETQTRLFENQAHALTSEIRQLRVTSLKLASGQEEPAAARSSGESRGGIRRLFAAVRTSKDERRARSDAEKIRRSGFFDSEWYLDANPDVRYAGSDPIDHYVRFGAWEGRDPSPVFSTDSYLNDHPELRSGRSNPLVHFIDLATGK